MRVITGLILIIAFVSCSNESKKEPVQENSIDYFNKELFDKLPSDSLKILVKELSLTSYVGQPLGKLLEKWNPKGYKTDNTYFTNSTPQFYSGISFHLPVGLQFKVFLKRRINADKNNMFKVNMGDATELKDEKIESYQIIYKDTYASSLKRLKSERDSILTNVLGIDSVGLSTFNKKLIADSSQYLFDLEPQLESRRTLVFKRD